MAVNPERASICDWAITANLQPEPITVDVWRNLPEEFCLDKMAEYADAGIPFYWLVWLSDDHVLSIDIYVLDHTLGYYRLFRTLAPEQEVSTVEVPIRIQSYARRAFRQERPHALVAG